MDNVYQLLDSRFKRHYLAYGSFGKLVDLLTLRLSLRNRLDQLFLRLQTAIKTGKVNDVNLKRQLSYLSQCFNNKIDRFILFKTDWYKETQYIGLVEAEVQTYFVKIFGNYEELLFQANQFNFVAERFSNYFSTITIEKTFQNVLASSYIPYKRAVDKPDSIELKILQMNNDFLSANAVEKQIKDMLPIDLRFVLAEQKELLLKIEQWLENQENLLPIIPIHGDMTPWNMFVGLNDNIVLVDYETSGWHAPFYDYFHYILQPIGLKNMRLSIAVILPAPPYAHAKQCLILYLIDQLYKHQRQIKQFVYNDKPLQNLVRNKTRWLLELLHG